MIFTNKKINVILNKYFNKEKDNYYELYPNEGFGVIFYKKHYDDLLYESKFICAIPYFHYYVIKVTDDYVYIKCNTDDGYSTEKIAINNISKIKVYKNIDVTIELVE